MNSASPGKARGSVLMLTLALVAMMTALSLAGLERTNHQSQLAAGLARHALLQTEAARTLAVAARNSSATGSAGGHTQPFMPDCPPQCNWQTARRTPAADGVTAVYIAQRFAPESNRFLIIARTTHTNGSEAFAYALFDADANAFRFVRR